MTEKVQHAPGLRSDDFVGKAFAAILLTGLAIVPLLYTRNGADVFRVGKLSVFRTEAILILAIAAIALLWNLPGARGWKPQRADALIAAAAVVWTAITLITSTNRVNSVLALLTIAMAMTLFLAATRAATVVAPIWLYVLLGAAVIVVGVLALQLRNIWVVIEAPIAAGMPPGDRARLAEGSLLGNRNYIATFLVLPAILTFVFLMRSRGWARLLHLATFIVIVAGFVEARTMTALAATAAGIITLLAMRSRKAVLIAMLTIGVLGAGYFTLYKPIRARALRIVQNLRAGDLGEFMSGRDIAYRAAWRMFLANPVLGVGPGRFAGEYFEHVVVAGEEPPSVNFGETHNDHLQVLAETGVPGYAIMLAAMVILGMTSFRARRDNAASAFAADAALPVATSFAVLALAQFPLQLAVTIVTYATVVGLLRGWAARDVT